MPAPTPEITERHERWQPAGGEQQWSDSFYFGGGDGRGLAFYARIGRRPNEDVTEAAVGLWLPGQGFLLSFARAAARGDEIAGGPLRFGCETPLLLWRLDLGASGRLYPRAEHIATHRKEFEEVELGGTLRFLAWHPPLAFRSGLSSGVAAAHYEQVGSVAGVVEVAGRRHPLAGAGVRDHSWGVRDWQAVPYWRWFGMVVDPDNFLMLNNVGTPGGDEVAGGFLMRGGEMAPIASCETESEMDPQLTCQRSFHAHAVDEAGRTTELRGRAVEVAPLRQKRDGMVTQVNEALTEYHWEGNEALGLSEYLVQTR